MNGTTFKKISLQGNQNVPWAIKPDFGSKHSVFKMHDFIKSMAMLVSASHVKLHCAKKRFDTKLDSI